MVSIPATMTVRLGKKLGMMIKEHVGFPRDETRYKSSLVKSKGKRTTRTTPRRL